MVPPNFFFERNNLYLAVYIERKIVKNIIFSNNNEVILLSEMVILTLALSIMKMSNLILN